MVETGLVCPSDHGELRPAGDALRCAVCGRSYVRSAAAAGAWDFRMVLHDEATGWDAAAFDRAYREAGLEAPSGAGNALSANIPPEAEAYREACKGRVLEELVRERRPERLLDLGCGNGWFCLRLAGLSPRTHFVGVDVSPYCVGLCRERLAAQGAPAGGMTVALAGGEELPFADGGFGVVVVQEVLEHVRDPERTLREVSRVLAPGGCALVTTPTRLMTQVWRAAAWLPARARRWWRGDRRSRQPQPQVHDRPLSRREIRRLIRGAGLETVAWRRVILLPHESYLQFIPAPGLRALVGVAKAMAKVPGAGLLGMHHLIMLRRGG